MKKVILGLFSLFFSLIGFTYGTDFVFPQDNSFDDFNNNLGNYNFYWTPSSSYYSGIIRSYKNPMYDWDDNFNIVFSGDNISNFVLNWVCFPYNRNSDLTDFSVLINSNSVSFSYDNTKYLYCSTGLNISISDQNMFNFVVGENAPFGSVGFYTNSDIGYNGDGNYFSNSIIYFDDEITISYNNVNCYSELYERMDYCNTIYSFGISSIEPSVPASCNFVYGNGLSGFFTSDQVLTINGYSILNGTTITPYFNISYTDQDNQVLTESYDKTNLILGGKFEKTYTGGENNFWVLTALGSSTIPDIIFTGSTLTGSSNISGNIFTNFVDNSFDVIGTNIPNFISYGFVLIVLIILIRLIKHFKKGGKGRI